MDQQQLQEIIIITCICRVLEGEDTETSLLLCTVGSDMTRTVIMSISLGARDVDLSPVWLNF